ncbi:hypothetical protein BDK51DRAFT_49939 [Blyttiomyces helicus]|uniref:Uncharacterized protein n=1 Tax=Blyttiomyces helicus TaxID=388810 RepID=A0A4P9WGN2_9FUNG|nr:hypothetical protein BDK51DRAFT_49939 [Blyttiomyces helicus]|eukprot:RKO91075.1 hypothetical protein BDK51DRAFT_49939 [Blyttiomyces helicus]
MKFAFAAALLGGLTVSAAPYEYGGYGAPYGAKKCHPNRPSTTLSATTAVASSTATGLATTTAAVATETATTAASTASATATPVNFVIMGDWGSGLPQQTTVAITMQDVAAKSNAVVR